MAQDRLFKELCTARVITIGWHLAQNDSRDDFVTDPIEHADFAANLMPRLLHIIEQVEYNRYRPRHLIEIDVPKSGLSVRPGNVLPIEEAALLHGIIYLLAPLLDKRLDKAVYSYRLHPEWKKKVKKGESMFREVKEDIPFLKKRTVRAITPFEAWYERWPAFEKDAVKAYTKEGYKYLAKTDITSYFENIDLRLLETQIRSYLKREEDKIIQLLFRILEGWTRVTSMGTPIGRGIPQGNDISSFLGNLYLIPLDRALTVFCKKRDAKWFRYVDDVKVFTKNKDDARDVVFEVNEALRSLYLNLQGSKTEVLSDDKLKYELDDKDFNKVDEVLDSVKKLDPLKSTDSKKLTVALKPLSPLVSRFRRGLPKAVKNLDWKANRLFRRLMTVYGYCRRVQLSESAFAAIKELPDIRILRKSLTYLTQLHYNTHDESVNALLGLLEHNDLPFPYQIGTVLETLANLHPKKPNAIASRIRKLALSRKQHWMITLKALEALLTYPYKPDQAKTIADRYVNNNHPMVRRAACVLLLRGPKHHVRNMLSQLIYHPDHSLNGIALYFRRFVQDEKFSKKEIAKMKDHHKTDFMFLKTLPQVYALAATENKAMASELFDYLQSLPATKSVKVKWHRMHLISLVTWAKKPATSAAVS